MFGSYFFIAKVSDNKDPDNLNRIKITFRNEVDVVSAWIPYLTSLAGDGVGFSSLPDVEQQVLVAALDMNRRNMVALGSFWSESFTPPETGENSDADFNSNGKNSLNFLKSKSENMIIFDDTEGKEKLQIIQKKTNNRLEFIAEEKKISLTTDETIEITAKKELNISAEKINIESDKELNFSCEDYQLKASKEVSVEASKDITLKGSGIALN